MTESISPHALASSDPLSVKLQLRLPPPPVALQHQPPERMLSSYLWLSEQMLQGWNPLVYSWPKTDVQAYFAHVVGSG